MLGCFSMRMGCREMKVEIKPTEKVKVLGLDERSLESMAWCAATYGINRLFWVDGHLICTEVYEKSFEHEIAEGEFCISQVCHAEYPRYTRVYEVERGTQVPIVDASDMKIYRKLLEAILERGDDRSE
jgi:predicted ATPase